MEASLVYATRFPSRLSSGTSLRSPGIFRRRGVTARRKRPERCNILKVAIGLRPWSQVTCFGFRSNRFEGLPVSEEVVKREEPQECVWHRHSRASVSHERRLGCREAGMGGSAAGHSFQWWWRTVGLCMDWVGKHDWLRCRHWWLEHTFTTPDRLHRWQGRQVYPQHAVNKGVTWNRIVWSYSVSKKRSRKLLESVSRGLFQSKISHKLLFEFLLHLEALMALRCQVVNNTVNHVGKELGRGQMGCVDQPPDLIGNIYFSGSPVLADLHYWFIVGFWLSLTSKTQTKLQLGQWLMGRPQGADYLDLVLYIKGLTNCVRIILFKGLKFTNCFLIMV